MKPICLLLFLIVFVIADAQPRDEASPLRFTGLFEFGFETSLFISCDNREEEWWLSWEDSSVGKKIRPLGSSMLTVVAKVTPDSESRRHKLSARGLDDWADKPDLSKEDARYVYNAGYGHLGSYDREISVVSLVEYSEKLHSLERDDDSFDDVIDQVTSLGGMDAIRQSFLEANCPSS